MNKDTNDSKLSKLSSISFLHALKPKINKARKNIADSYRSRLEQKQARFEARLLGNFSE